MLRRILFPLGLFVAALSAPAVAQAYGPFDVPSAYKASQGFVHFESRTLDRCVKNALHIPGRSLIQVSALSTLEQLTCEVSLSYEELVAVSADLLRFPGTTHVRLGVFGAGQYYLEGVASVGAFVPGVVVEGRFHPGFFTPKRFIPSAMLWRGEDVRIIPGQVHGDTFVPGVTASGRFVAGNWIDETFVLEPANAARLGSVPVVTRGASERDQLINRAGLATTGGVALVSSGGAFLGRVGDCVTERGQQDDEVMLDSDVRVGAFVGCLVNETRKSLGGSDAPPDTTSDDDASGGGEGATDTTEDGTCSESGDDNADDDEGDADDYYEENSSNENNQGEVSSEEEDDDAADDPNTQPVNPWDEGYNGGGGVDERAIGDAINAILNVFEPREDYGGGVVAITAGDVVGSVINVFDGDYEDHMGGVVVGVDLDALIAPVINNPSLH